MKYQAIIVVFATLFVLGIVPKARAGQEKVCSNATLQGSFGYTATGTLLPASVSPPYAGPYAEVGRQTFDGKGNTHATATLSANGNIFEVTIEGTYNVNPDCTGSMILSSSLGVEHADLVIDDDGAELRAICADLGVVKSHVYKRQFRGDCKDQSKLTSDAHQLLLSLPAVARVQLSSTVELRPAWAYFDFQT
jgi:hypothetical protein